MKGIINQLSYGKLVSYCADILKEVTPDQFIIARQGAKELNLDPGLNRQMQKFSMITNPGNPDFTPIRVQICDDFLTRFRGLMFRRSLPANEGILLVQKGDSQIDSSIHMLFMRFDLAVVWINSEYEVVDIRHARKWRAAYTPNKPARYVLEMPLENIAKFNIGDRVMCKDETRE